MSRAELSITPTSLNSGSVSGQDFNLFGRGAVVNAASGVSARINGLDTVLNNVQTLANTYAAAETLYITESGFLPNPNSTRLAELRIQADTAKLAFIDAATINFYDALGLTSENLSADRLTTVNEFVNSLLDAQRGILMYF